MPGTEGEQGTVKSRAVDVRLTDDELMNYIGENEVAFAHVPKYDVPKGILAAFDLRDCRARLAAAEAEISAGKENYAFYRTEMRSEVETLTVQRDGAEDRSKMILERKNELLAERDALRVVCEKLAAVLSHMRDFEAYDRTKTAKALHAWDEFNKDNGARQMLAEAEAKGRVEALGLLVDAWFQWAIVPDGFDGYSTDAPRHDGCLRTLEDISQALVEAGRLVKYDKAPKKDWYVYVPPAAARTTT